MPLFTHFDGQKFRVKTKTLLLHHSVKCHIKKSVQLVEPAFPWSEEVVFTLCRRAEAGLEGDWSGKER